MNGDMICDSVTPADADESDFAHAVRLVLVAKARDTRSHVDQRKAAADHVHGYDEKGNPIKVDDNKHIPTTSN